MEALTETLYSANGGMIRQRRALLVRRSDEADNPQQHMYMITLTRRLDKLDNEHREVVTADFVVYDYRNDEMRNARSSHY